MQLPKRVPWASLSELEELCSWIYSDETDLHTKQLAVNKVIHPLSTFQTPPPYHAGTDPHFLLLSSVIGLAIGNPTVTRPRVHIRALDCDTARQLWVTAPLIGRVFWV